MNKLRTFLTGFSVAWGIFILVMLLASVKGMENGFRKQMMGSASNSIYINSLKTKKPFKGFAAGRKPKLTNEDITFIQESFTNEVEYLTPILQKGCAARYKKETGKYSFKGVGVDYQVIKQIKLIKGRGLSKIDKIRKVVVLGEEVALDLFGEENAVGKDLIINNTLFKVIGIFTHEENKWVKRVVLCPIETMQKMYKSSTSISTIGLTYNPSYGFLEATNFSKYLEQIFKIRHKVAQGDSGFYMDTKIEDYSDMTSFVAMLQGISIFVGILILIAGIVGIGNILVVIIKERTKEIGIRKAIGAKPSQIISLVILESIFITTISGLVGVFLAVFIVSFAGPVIDLPAFSNPTVDIEVIIIALVILIVSGVLAGLIPAIRAARVKPIVALRGE